MPHHLQSVGVFGMGIDYGLARRKYVLQRQRLKHKNITVMKTRNLISAAAFSLLFFSFIAANAQYRSVPNTAWKRGEKLTYIIYFDSFLTGKIKAAYGTFEVLPETETVGGRTCNHIVASGATFKKYNWAIFVNDRFDSYVDEAGQFPLLFLRRAHEGNFTANQDIVFNHGKTWHNLKTTKKKRPSITIFPPMHRI